VVRRAWAGFAHIHGSAAGGIMNVQSVGKASLPRCHCLGIGNWHSGGCALRLPHTCTRSVNTVGLSAKFSTQETAAEESAGLMIEEPLMTGEK